MQCESQSRILTILALLILPAWGARAQSIADEARMAAAHFSAVMTSRVAEKLNGPCSDTTVTGSEDGELSLASAGLVDPTCSLSGTIAVSGDTSSGYSISGGASADSTILLSGMASVMPPPEGFPFGTDSLWIDLQFSGGFQGKVGADIPLAKSKLKGSLYTFGQATISLTQPNAGLDVLTQLDMLTTQMIQRRSDLVFGKVFDPYAATPILPRTTVAGTGQISGNQTNYLLEIEHHLE